jgi:hypothetical protein
MMTSLVLVRVPLIKGVVEFAEILASFQVGVAFPPKEATKVMSS